MNVWDFIVAGWHAIRNFFFSLFYESYFAQALLLLLLLSLPFCIRAVRRIRFLSRIKRLCREKGYVFNRHRAFSFLGNFKNASCEYSITTKTRAFAIKLVGAKSKNHLIRFLDEENLEILKSGKLMGAALSARRTRVTKMPNQRKWYPHPTWEFFTYADRDLPTESIVLCIPAPSGAAYRRRRDTGLSNNFEFVPLRDGMHFFETIYHTPEGFFEKLQNYHEGYRLYTE